MKAIAVIPTYDEKENLPRLIREIEKQKVGIDVLIVDDNSPDGTGVLAEELSRKCSYLHVLHRRRKEGLGRACRDGFKWALDKDYEVIMQMDADLSHDPCAIPLFLEKIKYYDAVFGRRVLSKTSIYNWLYKGFLSELSNKLIGIILGIDCADTTTAFKCFKRKVLESIDLDSIKGRQNAFLIELVYRTIKSRFRTVDIPFTLKQREAGRSKMGFSVVIECVYTVLKLAKNRIHIN